MATRNPLFHRSRTVLAASPRPTKLAAGLKRPRSPGITVEEHAAPVASKRAKAAPDTPSHKQKRKELQETEWREKYIRAIRGWKFHFSEDIQNTDYVKILEKRILQLGAVCLIALSLFNLPHISPRPSKISFPLRFHI